MAVVINHVSEKDEFVCIHGQIRADENTLIGDYTYVFMFAVEGTNISTPREHIDNFDTYQEMYDRFSGETTVTPEEYL